MAHPFSKDEKTSRHAKHHSMGVKGEHPDNKAGRLCRAKGGSVGTTHDMPVKEPKGKLFHVKSLNRPRGG